MRRLFFAIVLALAPQAAVACDYLSADGRSLTWIEHDDYDFRVTAEGSETLCAILRSPERTTGVCEDGTEAELSRGTSDEGRDLVYFDDAVWVRACLQPGFNLTERKTEY